MGAIGADAVEPDKMQSAGRGKQDLAQAQQRRAIEQADKKCIFHRVHVRPVLGQLRCESILVRLMEAGGLDKGEKKIRCGWWEGKCGKKRG